MTRRLAPLVALVLAGCAGPAPRDPADARPATASSRELSERDLDRSHARSQRELGGGGGGGMSPRANDGDRPFPGPGRVAEAPPHIPSDPGAEDETERRLDRQRITLNFDKTPLAQALEFIRDVSGLNLVISQAAQEKIDQEQIVSTLRLKDVSVRNALTLTLAANEELTGEIRSDMLVVGLKGHVKTKQVTAFYDVGDIVSRRPDYAAPTMGLPEGKGGGGKGNQMDGAIVRFPDDGKDKNKGAGVDGDKLVEIVQKLCGDDPNASVELTARGTLMVRTTEAAHRRISGELDGLKGK